MIVALSLRLIATSGTVWALAGFLGLVCVAALLCGFIYTGKTWCNYVCPIGMVEKLYTEPSRLGGRQNSQCQKCTACKKHCPDIDLEQGYWKEANAPWRRVAYYTWPGIVLGFYLYYYLQAGDWDIFFSGIETLDDQQAERWLGPGFFFLQAIPTVVAAPLTLVVFGALSWGLFSWGERIASFLVPPVDRRWRYARQPGNLATPKARVTGLHSKQPDLHRYRARTITSRLHLRRLARPTLGHRLPTLGLGCSTRLLPRRRTLPLRSGRTLLLRLRRTLLLPKPSPHRPSPDRTSAGFSEGTCQPFSGTIRGHELLDAAIWARFERPDARGSFRNRTLNKSFWNE
jgi:hypothetical protein